MMNDVKHYGRKPVLQSLLIAEHVYQDHQTGKYIVAGIFNELRHFPNMEDVPNQQENNENIALNFPPGHQVGSPYVYLNLTEISGKQTFFLRYVSLEENNIIYQVTLEISSDDPLSNHQGAIPFLPLPLEEGVYALELLWGNEEPLGSTRITVKNFSNEKAGDEK